MIKILSPVPGQVVQRHGFAPENVRRRRAGEEVSEHGLVPIIFSAEEQSTGHWQYRVDDQEWRPLDVMTTGKTGVANAKITSAGWFRLAIRCERNNHPVAEAAVEPVAIGEVFLIAGDCAAAGPPALEPLDARAALIALDPSTGAWSAIEAARFDHWWARSLLAIGTLVRCPVGVVDISAAGSTLADWAPGRARYAALKRAGQAVDLCRSVLWQCARQGDAGGASYAASLTALREAVHRDWGHSAAWIVARSPGAAYDGDVDAENAVRHSIDHIDRAPGFTPGPDLDLIPEGISPELHLSIAATLWFASIWKLIAGKCPAQQP